MKKLPSLIEFYEKYVSINGKPTILSEEKKKFFEDLAAGKIILVKTRKYGKQFVNKEKH